LPDKAIDVIDETGAAQMLVPENKRRKTITAKEVEACIATMARIPPKSVSRDDREVLKNLDRDLKMVVFGQDPAIESLVSAIKLGPRRLRDPEKPIGSYLFSGPTGVGKTEVARQLARTMGIEITRFDMSEYMERHTVSRLIGAPPGYVGFDQGGLLTDAIDQHPHSVLAARRDREGASRPVQHPAAGHGLREVDRPQRQERRFPQRHPDHDHQCRRLRPGEAGDRLRSGIREGDDQEAINRMFTPEFRNRLDAVISFAALSPETIGRSSTSSSAAGEQLADRNVTIELDAGPRLAGEKGYDPLFGARPLAASSRSTSRSRSPRSCCSARWRRAASSACRSIRRPTSWSSRSASARRPAHPSPRKPSCREETRRRPLGRPPVPSPRREPQRAPRPPRATARGLPGLPDRDRRQTDRQVAAAL
jgi:ATP-dependent Clp protease ATP-binding subunit ClpA